MILRPKLQMSKYRAKRLGFLESSKQRLRTFCHETSLHGWSYLAKEQPLYLSIIWALVIFCATGLGIAFIVTNTTEYMNSSIVTNIESTTASLNEIYFPSITVCNINQVEASFLRSIGIYNNLSQTNALYDEYITGKNGGLNAEERAALESISWLNTVDLLSTASNGSSSMTKYSRQKCENMFLYMGYQKKELYWRDISPDLGPFFYGTDYGSCCFFNGVVNMKMWPSNATSVDQYHHGVPRGAKNGEANGMTIILDAEKFNYAFFRAGGSGFKIAIQDHRDKPIMEHSAIFVLTGTETQLAVAPSLTYTTTDAIESFNPLERKCYRDFEVNLTYFPYEDGYRYDMGNCMFHEAIKLIIWECRCIPSFHHIEVGDLPFCTGERLICMQSKLSSMTVGMADSSIVMPEAKENPDKIGDLRRPPNITCLPRCRVQENQVQLSHSSYPQQYNFVYQRSFCETASHVYQVSCQSPDRKFFLNHFHPNLCETLGKHEKFFKIGTNCTQWPDTYFSDNLIANKSENELTRVMQKYAAENLANVRIMIRNPYITKISRDQEMTFTSYVANTGGLLGLCIGCSFVSFLEIIYHCFFKILCNFTRLQ